MLNSGEVPNLFASEDRITIAEGILRIARQVLGKIAGDMTIPELNFFFLTRVKENLHVLLAFLQ